MIHHTPGVSRHFVLAAGGTGGHLLPAFALAAELDRRGHHVALVTDERGAKIPGKPSFLPAHVLPAGRLGKNPVALAKGLAAIWRGRAMALRLFESFQPACVVGFGGYPALPALLAARAARIPTVIHEQNAVLGRVNRFLAKGATAIATAYGEVERLDPKLWGKVHRVGNPVRAEVLALRGEAFPEFTEDSLFRVLITGGSQGASILSEVVPDGLAMLPPALRHRLQVTQQCRPEDIEAVRARYAGHQIPAELGTYFEDMATRLADTHLFIGRSGASTIAELTAVGRPAILVPLPIATDDHQAVNAREMVKAGGARAIRQSGFTPKELAKQIQTMALNPMTLANAAHAAWNCGLPNAVKDLADLVEGFGGVPLMDVIRAQGMQAAPSTREALAKESAE
ncbi:UDP-diphospho-muramoylpentapeptide beta-N-acetylglucosaminyltransferase [Novosphingobium fuchskuhlense]|uniref:UDP-N-acetylglucosamine--N-acetylmuramyl-(pentapeptide) pyrophosphoryl-undecaprenol N-acetylglucosamine transferase n=1 Tax=Novosphingobium fuchskuhlense TaxID=1117702 RepID=A0A124JTJ7_9SPHN|nr:undecaprenyldiphospho-muramoylpentapeptide beta-N-acetylglucosaminyltransferase [Novosphingobium fuchskuhlense]KUR70237.1 UDP-diphospho-muramoylpentapeptide beta-N-acetylglucosaminyltransferase [Novosphingobium fuchskuhlense]